MKYTIFFIFVCIGLQLQAQTALPIPQGLTASYKKYHNRIELKWEATAAGHRYIIWRSTRNIRAFTRLDTVQQNRYIDRNNLRASTDYVYQVQALAGNGTVSDASAEAVGALLVIADGLTPGKDSISLNHCIVVTPTEVKATPSIFVFRFLLEQRCAQLSGKGAFQLYYSTDTLLDQQDTLLARQNILLSRSRGALTARRKQLPAEGYLLLLIVADEKTMLVYSRIE